MNYWRRYIGDYGRDTTRLTLAEHGAYGLLLDYYYAEEQPIPLDLDEVCRMVRAITPVERKAVERVLNTYFVKAADGYHNERADKEICVSNSARNNGKKGGNPWRGELYKEPGYIYAVRGSEYDIVKIGITIDPKRRLTELKYAKGCTGEMLVVLPVAEMGTAEQAVLENFSDEADGEWLKIGEARQRELLSFMESFRVPEHTGELVAKRKGANEGGYVPGHEGGSGHPPTTNHQPPTTSLPATNHQPEKPSAGRGKRAAAAKVNGESKTGPTEQAYVAAYRQRYHVAPVINAKVRGMLSKFLDRVPADEAPQIAGSYVGSNRGLYVSSKHCVDLLLRDAEGLRTEWFTGRQVTDTEARIADRAQATGNAFSGLLKESERAK